MTTPIVNVAMHLSRQAAEDPNRVAIYVPGRHSKPRNDWQHQAVTFAELDADSSALAHGLVAAGITRGTRTVLMVPPGIDFFALTFALLKVAAVPVLIDPGMGLSNLGRCLAEAEPEAFVGIAQAHLARLIGGWGRKTLRTTVNVGRGTLFCHTSSARLRRQGAGRGPFPVAEVSRDELAAILFTSGSTGIAKGAEYTHGVFAAQIEILKSTFGIEPGEIDLCTFPLFALFGPALGMSCVIPDMDPTRPARIDPVKAVAQINRFGVTNLFGSPAVIRRLGDYGVSLPSLRRAISAGAPASAAAVERFSRLLSPGVELYTPYGATEALPVSNIASSEILGETRPLTEQGRGVCVGRPVPGVTVRVVPITDQPIPEWDDSLELPPGEVGEFVVGGPVVTRRYFNRPDATRLAKIRDPRTGEILHRMGDVGYRDDRGRLWFCGRKSHRVVTPFGTLYTDIVEPILNTVPGVARTALVGVTRHGTTYPVVCVELIGAGENMRGAGVEERHKLLNEVLPRHAWCFEPTRSIVTFLHYPDSFPVDVRHNSKISREKLAAWADRKLGPAWRPGGGT